MTTKNKILTVFTPTYNRAHTLTRLYESLCSQSCQNFEWLVVDDGSTDSTEELVAGFAGEGRIPIRYIYKENGGLHTAYNTAYANIETELCVCIDSDDYMPDNAVELIVNKWQNEGSDRCAGIIGLDFYADSKQPIGGLFPAGLKECYLLDLFTKRIHIGDTKQAMRTELMKRVAPQTGFGGEKNFNPIYMLLQVCDDYPLLVLNENLCFVDYQPSDSMSANIYRQYADSPRSFAKLRALEMGLKRNDAKNRFRSAVHYVSSCLLSKDWRALIHPQHRLKTFLALVPGYLWYLYIRSKIRTQR